jgi:hypothetical protein
MFLNSKTFSQWQKAKDNDQGESFQQTSFPFVVFYSAQEAVATWLLIDSTTAKLMLFLVPIFQDKLCK